MADEVLTERLDDGTIGSVTLNRPDRHNAMNRALSGQLTATLHALDRDPAVRAIIVRGAGERAFSSGADLYEMRASRTEAVAPEESGSSVGTAIEAPATLAKPVIAMIHGYCIGGGCELALACDLRIADDRARFGIPAAKLGVVLDVAEVRRLYEAVGGAVAKEMLFTGRMLDAREALAVGLTNQVVAPDELYDTVIALARQIAANAPTTVASVKALINGMIEGVGAEELAACRARFAAHAARGNERDEGVRAFRERRAPNFSATDPR